MKAVTERDYVLGTNDEEIQRLGLQHRVWQQIVIDCWRRAGIGEGSRVLDIGAGPGYATADLAKLVGPAGRVVAVERSQRFLNVARQYCQSSGIENVQFREMDLMNDPLPESGMDAAWCRWVACFVSSPELLVAKIANALRPGGVAIFHEYINYSTYRLAPRSVAIEQFVVKVGESWRANGGEPDIAMDLPTILAKAGFRVRSAEPRIFCIGPHDEAWQWPASFVQVNLKRLLELGRVDEAWVESVRREFAAAEANPNSLMMTPMVLEIVAEKRGYPQI